MRLVSLLLPGLASVLLAVACRANGPSGPTLHLPVAEARASCGPTDGPAVEVLLATARAGDAVTPVPPLVRVIVFRSRQELAGRTWLLAPELGVASLQRVLDAPSEQATSARAARCG